MSRKKDNSIWKKQFGIWLKRFFDEYKLDYYYFAEKYHWSASTVRYWFEGRCLPRQQGIIDIKEYLPENLRKFANEGYIQLLPGVNNTDGFFISAMRKKGF